VGVAFHDRYVHACASWPLIVGSAASVVPRASAAASAARHRKNCA
jgi:hypothetical protein